MDTRHAQGKYSDLPVDFTKMVLEVFENTYEKGLKAFHAHTGKKPVLLVSGRIYADEIVLAVSLTLEKSIGATTVYASCDFDLNASAPTAQDLLPLCVDAAGAVFNGLLDNPTKATLQALESYSLADIEDAPLHWSPIEIDKRTFYVKLDKAHLVLDRLADDWLKKNDPEMAKTLEEEELEAEEQIIAGPKNRH